MFINEKYKDREPGLKGRHGKFLPYMDPDCYTHKMFQLSSYDNFQIRRLSDSVNEILSIGIDNYLAKIKSLRLYMQYLLGTVKGIQILNTTTKYSGHIAIRSIKEGFSTQELYEAMINAKLICDTKENYKVVRIGFAPLYITFTDCYHIYQTI